MLSLHAPYIYVLYVSVMNWRLVEGVPRQVTSSQLGLAQATPNPNLCTKFHRNSFKETSMSEQNVAAD